MKTKFSPTNWINLTKTASFIVVCFVLYFLLVGITQSTTVLDFYGDIRHFLGCKHASVWALKNELKSFLPILLSAVLIVFKINITIK